LKASVTPNDGVRDNNDFHKSF